MRSPVVAPLTRALIGLPLVLFTTETARYFAWTIEPPITAGFLGANYWASAHPRDPGRTGDPVGPRPCLGVGRARVRSVTTIATLQHLDQFHLDTFYGWFWVVAYTIYPIQLG